MPKWMTSATCCACRSWNLFRKPIYLVRLIDTLDNLFPLQKRQLGTAPQWRAPQAPSPQGLDPDTVQSVTDALKAVQS